MRRLLTLGTLMMASSWVPAAMAQDGEVAPDDGVVEEEETVGVDVDEGETAADPIDEGVQGDEGDGASGGDADDGADSDPTSSSKDTILPLPEAARPLVSPPMTIRGDFHVPIISLGFPGFSQTAVGFPFIGGGISLTDWVQLDAAVIPIIVSPSAEYFSPELGATFSFTDNDADFEIGARVSVQLPGSTEYYAVNAGIPLRFHLIDKMLRIDTGAYFAMYGSTAGGDPAVGLMQSHTIPFTAFGPSVPADFTVSIIDYVYAKAGTGFGIIDLTENFLPAGPGDLVFIPLGFGAGANIPVSREMVIDGKFDFSFPLFATPGSPGDKVNPDFYQVGITGSVHYSIE